MINSGLNNQLSTVTQFKTHFQFHSIHTWTLCQGHRKWTEEIKIRNRLWNVPFGR